MLACSCDICQMGTLSLRSWAVSLDAIRLQSAATWPTKCLSAGYSTILHHSLCNESWHHQLQSNKVKWHGPTFYCTINTLVAMSMKVMIITELSSNRWLGELYLKLRERTQIKSSALLCKPQHTVRGVKLLDYNSKERSGKHNSILRLLHATGPAKLLQKHTMRDWVGTVVVMILLQCPHLPLLVLPASLESA